MTRARGLKTILMLAFVAPAVLAGQERRQGGPPPYDLAREVIVKGTMVGTETIAPAPDRHMLLLKATIDGGPMQLILAPPDWVAKQKFDFKPGAVVEVTGVAGYRANSTAAMMVRLLKSGGRTLTLRDAEGRPRWIEPGREPGAPPVDRD